MGLGPGEIVLILVIAYVIVGPEDMVKFARTLGKAVRRFKKLSAEMKDELDLPAMTDLTKELGSAQPGKAAKAAADAAVRSVDPDLDSVLEEIRKTEELLKT